MKHWRVLTVMLCLALLVPLLAGCAPAASSSVTAAPTCPPVEPAPTCPPAEPVPTCPPLVPAASSQPDKDIAEAESLVQGYISAWANKDPDEYLSLWSEDGTFMEHSALYEVIIGLSESWIRADLTRGDSETFIDSYFISQDGRRAALQGRVTVLIKDGEPVTVPAAIIFDFEDGQIVHGELYHDDDAYE